MSALSVFSSSGGTGTAVVVVVGLLLEEDGVVGVV